MVDYAGEKMCKEVSMLTVACVSVCFFFFFFFFSTIKGIFQESLVAHLGRSLDFRTLGHGIKPESTLNQHYFRLCM